ncbi:hypothetical protein KCP73_03080 [Salmonella enterica subsp. enterica]|nr:hypothetical protein KCP73_03080 [Salmonella enterica subsp. enterica]
MSSSFAGRISAVMMRNAENGALLFCHGQCRRRQYQSATVITLMIITTKALNVIQAVCLTAPIPFLTTARVKPVKRSAISSFRHIADGAVAITAYTRYGR